MITCGYQTRMQYLLLPDPLSHVTCLDMEAEHIDVGKAFPKHGALAPNSMLALQEQTCKDIGATGESEKYR